MHIADLLTVLDYVGVVEGQVIRQDVLVNIVAAK